MRVLFKAASSILSYGIYVFIAYTWWQGYHMQQRAMEQADKVHEENMARIDEAREEEKRINAKAERFMDEMKHEVAVQITRNVLVICQAQLDPNCDYVQSILRDGKVKAAEIGTSDQEVLSLVQKYRARYANYYAANGQ